MALYGFLCWIAVKSTIIIILKQTPRASSLAQAGGTPAKSRGNCHLCHSSGFQKYDKKCGKSCLQTLKCAPVDDNSANLPSTTQRPESECRCAKGVATILYLIPSSFEEVRLKFRKSVPSTIGYQYFNLGYQTLTQ